MADPAALLSPLTGTVASVDVAVGDAVNAGQVVGLIESMKLHHEVVADTAGTVVKIAVHPGETIGVGQVLLELTPFEARDRAAVEPLGSSDRSDGSAGSGPQGTERADLAAVIERHRLGLDARRPDAVERRRSMGRRTAREDIADLVVDGTFVEYGPLAIASQRSRRSHDELITRTPADGMVGGVGTVEFPGDGRTIDVVAVSYDYTVMAGTQGHRNHLKKDKLFSVAAQLGLPVVLFAEGGGGRPGDTDTGGATGLDSLAFGLLAELSGDVPLVAINTGYCFAGNAALVGVCDIIIATVDSNIGMAGPAMIEGGGLGSFAPTEIGPVGVQSLNGVIDLVVDDSEAAVRAARQYLSYFAGRSTIVDHRPQDALRDLVPPDRLRAYDVRRAIDGLFDVDSVLELRRGFGPGMITALARLDGWPVGVIANNPAHLSGAIDSDGADKAARFMQLCDAHAIPIITLVDTPGMMVGPDVEATGLVRHCSRLFLAGANLSVPVISVVLRKAYGLGAQAMMGGSTKAPVACLAWPTGEFGPMGLEGAVRLGYRAELDACTTDDERDTLFATLVDRLYEKGKALSIAEYFEIDDVIDPADTRRWLARLLSQGPPTRGRHPFIDAW